MWTASLGKQIEEPNDLQNQIMKQNKLRSLRSTVSYSAVTNNNHLKNTVDVFLKTQFTVCCKLFHLDPIYLNYVPKCRQTIKHIVKTRSWKTQKN